MTVKHGLADEFGLNGTLLPEYNGEYHEYFAFFSSNACIFFHQTNVGKYDCPTGNFICDGTVGPNFNRPHLTYNQATSYCREMNASLSKYRPEINQIFHRILEKFWTFLASFHTLEEYSSYSKMMNEVIIWTDFERINKTHFWSPTKTVYIKPDIDPDFGNRKRFNKLYHQIESKIWNRQTQR